MTAEVIGRDIKAILLNGESVEFETDGNAVRFTIPAELHSKNDLSYNIIYA